MAFGPAELGLESEPSDNYRTVQADTSWLGYFPSQSQSVETVIATFQETGTPEEPARRVDLLVRPGDDSVSLCFAESEEALEAVCTGARVLGRSPREIDAPWVGLLGSTEVDLLALLGEPIPVLDDVESLES